MVHLHFLVVWFSFWRIVQDILLAIWWDLHYTNITHYCRLPLLIILYANNERRTCGREPTKANPLIGLCFRVQVDFREFSFFPLYFTCKKKKTFSNIVGEILTKKLNDSISQHKFLTDAQPHPDFFIGLTIFLQWMAQALGEPNTLSSSLHLIRPSESRSAVNFWPWSSNIRAV